MASRLTTAEASRQSACPAIDVRGAGDVVLQHLFDRSVVSEAQIGRARRAAAVSGERIDVVLNKLGLVADDVLISIYCALTGLVQVRPAELEAARGPCEGVEPEFFANAQIVVLDETPELLTIAVADPLDVRAARALGFRTRKRTQLRVAARGAIDAIISRSYRIERKASNDDATIVDAAEIDDVDRLKDIASEAPVIRLVSELIEHAAKTGASDIHISRTAEDGRVRFRRDGQLHDVRRLTPAVHCAAVSRLKIMAALDIGERRVPQDGRIQVAVAGRQIDLRLSTMPHVHGEGAFIRILDHRSTRHDLMELRFSSGHVKQIKQILSHAHGLFLVTGPTGSGKTTTLYAALEHLNDPTKNIVTVEDPIEYTLAGINQIQVNRRAELDFARVLRSVLRQDPDVIMVGEIRDRETAAIAVQAALTGHFVLATLHTNDALTAIDRLLDMDVEAFLLASILRGTMAQRLVRRLCPHCKDHGGDIDLTPKPRCAGCNDTDCSGRLPLAEVIPVDPAMQDMIAKRASSADLARYARDLGYASLEQDGERLVKDGLTTRAEIMRAVGV